MGLRFRKSINLAPGVRINLTKKGVSSLSVGKRGATVNVGKKGTRGTVGIPVFLVADYHTPLINRVLNPSLHLNPKLYTILRKTP